MGAVLRTARFALNFPRSPSPLPCSTTIVTDTPQQAREVAFGSAQRQKVGAQEGGWQRAQQAGGGVLWQRAAPQGGEAQLPAVPRWRRDS